MFFKEPEIFLHILLWIGLFLTPIFSTWNYLVTKTWQFSESWHIVFEIWYFWRIFAILAFFWEGPFLTIFGLFYEIWYFWRFFTIRQEIQILFIVLGFWKKIICQVWGARPRNEVFYALPNDKGQQRDLWLDARVDLSMICGCQAMPAVKSQIDAA